MPPAYESLNLINSLTCTKSWTYYIAMTPARLLFQAELEKQFEDYFAGDMQQTCSIGLLPNFTKTDVMP